MVHEEKLKHRLDEYLEYRAGERHHDSEYLFPAQTINGGIWNRNVFSRRLTKRIKSKGMNALSLRRTFGSLLIRSGKTEKTRLDMNIVFDRLKQLKIIDKKDEAFIDNFLQPEKFILGKPLRQQNTENKLGDFNSKIFDDISGDTYEEDVLNYTEENYISDYKLRPISRAIKNHLLKNTIDITLPGLEFLIADNIKTSVGYKINVEIFKSDINDLSKQNSKLSGEFIILAKRHIFDCAAFKHKVSLNCGRITKQQEI